MPDDLPLPTGEPRSAPGDHRVGAGDPALHHEFTVIKAELLLLAEDLAVVTDELDDVREGTHPFVARMDADLAAVRSSLGHIGDDLAIATMTVKQVLVGLEQLIRATDDGSASAN